MKKSNKINKFVIIALIGLILTVSIVIFVLNYSKDDYSLTILEKSWVKNNSNKVIDVSIYNDIPIYGDAGEGIAFSFLEEFTASYDIEFNKVSYLEEDSNVSYKDFAFKVYDYSTELTDNDIVLLNDYYVLVSKDANNINYLSMLDNSSIGVFDNDATNIKYFLNDNETITYVACSSFKDMLNNLNNDKIKYAAIPKSLYLDDILSNNLSIVYHMNEYYKKYVISVKDNTLRSIVSKYVKLYNKDKYNDKYKEYFLNAFFKYKEISSAERMSYNANSYVYGFVANMPYENNINGEFVGIISNYLSMFEDLTDVDFLVEKYDSIEDLKTALSRGEVDMVFSNYSTEGLNIDTLITNSPLNEEYIVLSKNNIVVNSIRSLKDYTVSVVKDSYLYDYLKTNSIKTQDYSDTDELLRMINDDSIILVDKSTYDYYKNTKFKDYLVIYQTELDNEYRFVVRDVNKNSTFYLLYNYFVNSMNYKEIMYEYNTDYMINSKNEISNLIKYIVILFAILILFIVIVIIVNKRKNRQVILNKEDKLKYIDTMTSLKNRNYLNMNIKKWEENTIYPQSIVIIDLNNIKYINDNYGHEEGDEVIKSAASVLLNNQMENTDIMRTDGNEFLIYMVGYEEKDVQDFTRNINKELKELKHNFGATIGYSMITDNIKTIDDAINEATLSMRQAKERL